MPVLIYFLNFQDMFYDNCISLETRKARYVISFGPLYNNTHNTHIIHHLTAITFSLQGQNKRFIVCCMKKYGHIYAPSCNQSH